MENREGLREDNVKYFNSKKETWAKQGNPSQISGSYYWGGGGREDEARRSILQTTTVQLTKLTENPYENVNRTVPCAFKLMGNRHVKWCWGNSLISDHITLDNVQNSAICRLRIAPNKGTWSYIFIYFSSKFFILLKRMGNQHDNMLTANKFYNIYLL